MVRVSLMVGVGVMVPLRVKVADFVAVSVGLGVWVLDPLTV